MLRSETAGEPERMRRTLEGLRRYQEAPRDPPRPPMPAIAEARGAVLRDYGGNGPPVLFVPSLINPPGILDLSEEKSLLGWLAGRGFRPLLVDWGWDVADRRSLDVAGHVEEILLPFVASLAEPPALVGYCLGGTMALAAAARAETRGVATLAGPWHFSAFSEGALNRLGKLWQSARAPAAALGLLPMEVLQSAFWSLDPARTIAKFEAFAGMEPGSGEARAFVSLEDWANDGPPLPEAAARDLFERFLGEDLPGSGRWMVGGAAVEPERLNCPILTIASTTDRIVPEATALRSGERIEVRQGHVGMVVGGRARTVLWEPLAAWLSRATRG